ncbi:uncharacterized protein LOC126842074 isoform X1 [Adelges cooleyi]|uniref:uncharacterized protein LOC126842074 isoform X1 n=1 Tax=Adelges cooleyi TaxID=133065 RepID=UPI00217F87E0|nr:uncharacterized protein LOC126842074 isoform X1 [Adelges cooleyi]
MISTAPKCPQSESAGKGLGDNGMVNGINVKHESDEMKGYCLESSIQETIPMNVQVTNNLADEKCDLCLNSFTSEMQLKHHITTSHNGISKIDEITIKNEVDNCFEDNDMINGINVKNESDEVVDYCLESSIQDEEMIPMNVQVTNNLADEKRFVFRIVYIQKAIETYYNIAQWYSYE